MLIEIKSYQNAIVSGNCLREFSERCNAASMQLYASIGHGRHASIRRESEAPKIRPLASTGGRGGVRECCERQKLPRSTV